MRLGRIIDVDCGCDNRRDIMFTHGQLGIPEAAILAVAALAVVAALTYRKV